ncbi:AMP-binding enzyme, putative [Synechococcus sp. PCC 7335]|uniref:AMP-dependent synthetase/ligase n=1 Tax=Synechococcus sp. (strain ATCC 29403 / PCC 7335) TaxID=91464 RepID=UPI00017EC39E|nr:AMP-binding protein [Synechococcus sp. PCC 7335]EDX84193.1 AMP-binding enzyme, putative [Synechococcus sp. PCC 7335]
MTAALHEQEKINRAKAINYGEVSGIPDVWPIVAARYGNHLALYDPHTNPETKYTYGELATSISQFAAGLQRLGVVPGEAIALFSENRPRWMVADQGIMTAGAIDAVRGANSDKAELLFILNNSDSIGLVIQDLSVLDKIAGDLGELGLRFIILLTDEVAASETDLGGAKLLNFSELMALGAEQGAPTPVKLERDRTATLMYTSGTSGMPKGVMLTQSNLLSQIAGASSVVNVGPEQKVLSILPIWHCYERSFEYFVLSQGCTQIYTNIRTVKRDFKEHSPQYMVAVPRLWESIYDGVQRQFQSQPEGKQKLIRFFLEKGHEYITARRTLSGLRLDHLTSSTGEKLAAALKLAYLWPIYQIGDRIVFSKIREAMGGKVDFLVSGGGSIADYLEDFYEVVGIPILGGYGLTETSPITHVRRPWRNLRGADGQALPGTETAIVDPETRQPIPIGKPGLVLLRGPQVMKGYYKNAEATAKAIDSEGWFDTGDLGRLTDWGDLIITGRAKDTIVLTNGENIEPTPVENACLRSPYVDQIMLVGQDQKSVGALIVPNKEVLEKWAASKGVSMEDLNSKPIQDLYKQELKREISARPGYRPDERVGPFVLLEEPFTIENGLLTQTMKVKRPKVRDRYQETIDALYAQ